MSERLPGGQIYCYGLYYGLDQIGFQCFANYTPYRKGHKKIFHSNRTVIHPDYNGLGLGGKLINETSRIMIDVHDYRIMAKFSSVPVYKALIKDKDWRFLGEKRLLSAMKTGDNMDRKSGFREFGVKTYHFEFAPKG